MTVRASDADASGSIAPAARVPGADPLSRPLRFARARKGLARVIYAYHRSFHRRRLEREVVEDIAGRPVAVLPGVLNPKLMRTGAFFAAELDREPVITDAELLDMGTGSGVCAVVAARRAKHVVAVDLSEAAVRCAEITVRLNGLEDKIEVLQGDLFAPVRGRRFDVVLFNPPFLRGEPQCDADLAWRSRDVAERFAAELRDHLTDSGCALLALSTFGDARAFLRALEERHFSFAVRACREFVNERLCVYEVRPHRMTRSPS